MDAFEHYMTNGSDHWFNRHHAGQLTGPIAYFCAEYGFHSRWASTRAGSACSRRPHESASDMAMPVIGVGSSTGAVLPADDRRGRDQEHEYPDFDLGRLPFLRVCDPRG